MRAHRDTQAPARRVVTALTIADQTAGDQDTVTVPARLWEHLKGLYEADVRARLEHTRSHVTGRRGIPAEEILGR